MANTAIWITAGYDAFARNGMNGLKIEVLAKKVGISKSSFYHHFADVDLFLEHLLKQHLLQAEIMAAKEMACNSINPELIEVILAHKTDLLFNRQLRVNRALKAFATVLDKTNKIVGNAFISAWVKDLQLQLSPLQLEGIFSLALENFFLQITPENLNRQWLTAYFDQLNETVKRFT